MSFIFFLLISLVISLPATVGAATYYLSDTNITTPLETLATSAPASADSAQGWTVAQKGSGNFAAYRPDTTITRTSGDWGGEPTDFTQRGYRTAATLNGLFAAGNWVVSFKVKSNTYYAQKGYIKFRLWRSVNADGSGATQITPGWQSSSLIGFTAANQNQTGTITWNNISTLTLTSEYLFLEIEWACNTSGGNNGAIVYWVHNEGSAEKLDTPAYAPAYFSLAATGGAPSSAITIAELVSVSMVATGGNGSADIQMNKEITGVSLSMDATGGSPVAVLTMAEIVKAGSGPPPYVQDMGAYEATPLIQLTNPAMSADIQMFYPNETVRFDLAAIGAAHTAELIMGEGATFFMGGLAGVDIGSHEQRTPIAGGAHTAAIAMNLGITTVTCSLAAIGGNSSAEIIMAEVVSIEATATGVAPIIQGEYDIVGGPPGIPDGWGPGQMHMGLGLGPN